MPFSLLWAALRGHRSSSLFALILLIGWTGALRISPIVVAGAMAGALGGWWIIETPVLRRWGARRPSTREQMRLNGVRWRILVRDEPTVTMSGGLRTLQVSTGALETFDDDQLTALLTYQSARIAAGDALAGALAWLGVLPLRSAGTRHAGCWRSAGCWP